MIIVETKSLLSVSPLVTGVEGLVSVVSGFTWTCLPGVFAVSFLMDFAFGRGDLVARSDCCASLCFSKNSYMMC